MTALPLAPPLQVPDIFVDLMRGAGTKARRVGVSAGSASEKRSPLQGSGLCHHGFAPFQASFRRLSTKTWPVGPDGDCQLCCKCATEETVPIEIPAETGLTISLVPRWPPRRCVEPGAFHECGRCVPTVHAANTDCPHDAAPTARYETMFDACNMPKCQWFQVLLPVAVPIEISAAAVSGAAAHKCRRLQMSLETFGGAPGVRSGPKPPIRATICCIRATPLTCCRRHPADLLSRI